MENRPAADFGSMTGAAVLSEAWNGLGATRLLGPATPAQATPAGEFATALVAAVAFGSFLMLNVAVVGPWAKRKVMAAFWGKIGPNRHGPWGLLLIPADVLRLLGKELIVPERVDRPAWDLGPLLLMWSALAAFAVIPMGSILGIEVQIADPEVGILYAFALASMASLGVVMGGYASNNKFSLLGALRAVASNIAYEIPLVVTGASAVLFAGTLRTSEIVAVQGEPLVTLAGVTIPQWFGIVNPLAFALFLAANLAEVGRNPFDVSEAPTEIVAGYQTEYSSVYFVLYYAGEFVHIFLGGALAATLFLGGPAGPVLPGFVWFTLKMYGMFLFTQWMRASAPRIRIDQLLGVGWKGMLVLSFANLLLTAVLVGLVG